MWIERYIKATSWSYRRYLDGDPGCDSCETARVHEHINMWLAGATLPVSQARAKRPRPVSRADDSSSMPTSPVIVAPALPVDTQSMHPPHMSDGSESDDDPLQPLTDVMLRMQRQLHHLKQMVSSLQSGTSACNVAL